MQVVGANAKCVHNLEGIEGELELEWLVGYLREKDGTNFHFLHFSMFCMYFWKMYIYASYHILYPRDAAYEYFRLMWGKAEAQKEEGRHIGDRGVGGSCVVWEDMDLAHPS